jgi:hypothetical protein
MRNSHVLCLATIDGISKLPTPIFAVSEKVRFAIVAFATGRNARNEYSVPQLQFQDLLSDRLHDSYPFMSQDSPAAHGLHISSENMEVGATDGRFMDSDQNISGFH